MQCVIKKLRLLSCRKPRLWSECTLTWVYSVFVCISGCYGNLADGKKWIEKKRAKCNFDCWLRLQKIRYSSSEHLAHCYYIVFFFCTKPGKPCKSCRLSYWFEIFLTTCLHCRCGLLQESGKTRFIIECCTLVSCS